MFVLSQPRTEHYDSTYRWDPAFSEQFTLIFKSDFYQAQGDLVAKSEDAPSEVRILHRFG